MPNTPPRPPHSAGDGRARRSHGAAVPAAQTTLNPVAPSGGNGAMWVTVHHPHLPMTCGEQTEQDGGTKRNGGTNGGTKRAFSPRLIGEFGSLYITRFGAFWQRDDVGPLT